MSTPTEFDSFGKCDIGIGTCCAGHPLESASEPAEFEYASLNVLPDPPLPPHLASDDGPHRMHEPEDPETNENGIGSDHESCTHPIIPWSGQRREPLERETAFTPRLAVRAARGRASSSPHAQ